MKRPFWKTCSVLLEYKRALLIAVAGALLSAACFGAGIGMMSPILGLLLGKKMPVQQIITDTFVRESNPPAVQDFGRWLAAQIPTDAFWAFVLMAVGILTLTVVGSIGRYIHELLTITVSLRASMIWRDRLFRRLVHLPLLTTQMGLGDNISRIVVDTRMLSRGYQAILGKAIAEVFKGGAALIVALLVDYKLTFLALVAMPPIAILLSKFGRIVRRASRRTLHEQGRMMAALNESLAGARVVKVHNAEGYERRRFSRMNRQLNNEEMAMRQARALASPVIETLAIIAVLAVAIIASWYIFRKDVPPEQFMTVLFSLGAAGASLKPLTALHIQLRESDAAAHRILDILTLEPEPLGPETRNLPSLPRHCRSITFENVRFTFPGKNTPAVDGVSLHVPFGHTVAVVGSNGSGKTTLLSMLPRLIEPDEGRVLIDGVDISKVRLRSVREQIGVVTQDSVLFEGTIADNIAYGRRHVPREKIVEAAKAAHAHEFIINLPNGYDTMLGEGGTGLSGGQRQRLCIARAILRDPAILILDEATSQIDADSEAKIAAALRELRRGRTTFIIAHRLSTIVDSDLIVVMHDGRIIDEGKHGPLLERCDLYRTLNRTQLQPV